MIDLPRTVDFDGEKVILVDQRKLPEDLVFFECGDVECVAFAIKNMVVRGAPAIGATAAFGLALVASKFRGDRDELLNELRRAADLLRSTRPTAYNLFWAINRVLGVAKGSSSDEIREKVVEEARRIAEEDVENNRRIGEFGYRLIRDGYRVMTICNAGSLATVWYGTATAPMYRAYEKGIEFEVVALETRPVLQGARITAFELSRVGIPVKLIVDGAAGYVMSELGVDLVITGADRVLRDGTTYNKIGTYSLSILAKEHGIPFYVAAPTSTFDLNSKPEDVRIEMRDPKEVAFIGGKRIAPEGVDIINPAFDRTPPSNITGIITEKGIVRSPLDEGIRELFSRSPGA